MSVFVPKSGGRRRDAGHALVEFALVILPFFVFLLGIFDLGRGIYTYNAVAQAAREIARATVVHPYESCCTLGSSPEAQAAISTQKGQVPGLSDGGIEIACVDISDAAVDSSRCQPGDFVKVTVRVDFELVTPLLGELGPWSLGSVSRMEFS